MVFGLCSHIVRGVSLNSLEKKNAIVIIIIATLLSFQSYSQSYSHTQSFGDDWVDNFDGMAVDSKGNTYFSGFYTGDFYFGDSVFQPLYGYGSTFESRTNRYILKSDATGEVQWIKRSGQDTLFITSMSGEPIFVDQEDNVYVNQLFRQGKDYQFDGQLYADNDTSNVNRFSKYDSEGNLQWSKVMSSFVVEDYVFNESQLFVLARLPERLDLEDTLLSSEDTRYVIASLAVSTGILENLYVFPDGVWASTLTSLDGMGLIVSGRIISQTEVGDSIGLPPGVAVPFIANLNSQLEAVTLRHYLAEFPGGATVSDVVGSSEDSLLIMCGYYSSIPDTSIFFGKDTISTSLGKNSGFVAAMDLSGNALWLNQFYGEKGNRIYKVAINNDGYIYGAGDISYQAVFMDTVFDLGPDYEGDLIVAKFTKQGDLVWAESPGGTAEDNFENLLLLGDDVYLAGESNSTSRILIDLTDGVPSWIERVSLNTSKETAYFMRISDCNTRIEVEDDGLHIPEGEEYAWYKDGELVQSGLSSDYLPQSAGNYWAWVTYDDGCKVRAHKVWSDVITDVNAPIASLRFSIYPNPVEGNLRVVGDYVGSINLTISDLAGQVLIKNSDYNLGQEIDLEALSFGLFIVQLESSDAIEAVRFTKM